MNIIEENKLKFFPLGKELLTSEGSFEKFIETLTDDQFVRTKIAYNKESVEDLTQRSSWTFNKEIKVIDENMEDLGYEDLTFTLLKYEKDDFFKLHKDSRGSHTCLIFGNSQHKGGTLTLKLQNELMDYNFHPDKMTDGYYMVIFSTDFLHEVSPIIEGKRYVLKTTLYEEEVDSEEEIDLKNQVLDVPCDDSCDDY